MAKPQPVAVPGMNPAGHYSPAVVHGGLVYVSGQLSIKPGDASKHLGTVAEQTEVALDNVAAVLEAAGSDLAHVIQMTIYVSDVAHWPEVNKAYARILGELKPARAIVPVPALNHGCALEIQATAALP